MKRLVWAGLGLQLYSLPAFAQNMPATTPSTSPVTTPPAAGAQPPSGGPNSMPTSEPANAIDNSGVTPGANSFTEAQARDRLTHEGYGHISTLAKDTDGIWRGFATRNGATVHVALDYQGHVSSH